ncbi:MAG: heavy-metal-associated domain-containing protein [Clostridiaceae bacterium]
MRKRIMVEGMSCNHCKMHVEEALMELEGAKSAQVNLETKTAILEGEKEISDSDIKDIIKDYGYEVKTIENL